MRHAFKSTHQLITPLGPVPVMLVGRNLYTETDWSTDRPEWALDGERGLLFQGEAPAVSGYRIEPLEATMPTRIQLFDVYMKGVEWIAMTGDPLVLDIDAMQGTTSVVMLAAMFERNPRTVAEHVVAYRRKLTRSIPATRLTT